MPPAYDSAYANDEQAVLPGLRAVAPLAAAVIDAVLAEDAAVIVASAPQFVAPCEEYVTRAGDDCQRLGLPHGTIVRKVGLWQMFAADEAQAIEGARHMLEGRAPRLALLARRADGRYLAVFHVTPSQSFSFPGGLQPGPADVRWLRLQIQASAPALIEIGQNRGGSPPLEPLRYDTVNLGLGYDVLFASDAFVAHEQAWQAEQDRMNGTSSIDPDP
jgi:hypothetical protein